MVKKNYPASKLSGNKPSAIDTENIREWSASILYAVSIPSASHCPVLPS